MMTRKHRSSTRVVQYNWNQPDASFDEAKVADLLAHAERAGIVTQYDTGRGSACWLNGRPGADLRRVRNMVTEIVGFPPRYTSNK